jgi:hypothetical protein
LNIVQQTDFTLLFGTILLFVVVLLAVVGVIVLLRRFFEGLTKWRYRRKYDAQFRRNQP